MSIPIAFLICTEPGRLEKQSLLLAESIREFGGDLKDTPIYSFHPRKGEPILSKTKKIFDALDVFHEQIILNIDYHDYYPGNKPIVCAYAEQNIDAEILVFLDSDKCIFSEPKELLLPPNYNVGLRSEYGKGIGSKGKEDIQDVYWQKLYELLDVKRETFVHTPIGNKKIRAYWNSGLVAVRRNAGIFTAWKNNFEKVMQHKLEPAQGNYFTDQTVLSATVCSMEEDVFTFSPSYSYPLPLHNRLTKEFKMNRFDNIVSIHYFNLFFYNNWQKTLNNLNNLDKKSDKYRWLCEAVAKHDMPFKKVSHDYILKLRRVEQKLLNYNIKINLSHLMERLINTD